MAGVRRSCENPFVRPRERVGRNFVTGLRRGGKLRLNWCSQGGGVEKGKFWGLYEDWQITTLCKSPARRKVQSHGKGPVVRKLIRVRARALGTNVEIQGKNTSGRENWGTSILPRVVTCIGGGGSSHHYSHSLQGCR